ncbi:hypothetical protein ABID22_002378 [Pontibacter aydingkolensis]|uniref:Uncharacterized protein n=1 Tax=Pontibacter aydingkolensis TaxID=1911536 RepID=A0ABS7CVX9_9BACT|nr:hypothetical protein [Pontibacter aydingkolensis]MBW7467979.1 hypothetical protein [Pontibacter aydingkolensis]
MNELISLSRMVTFCNSISSSLPDKDLKGKEGFFVDKLIQKSYETDEEAALELYNSNPNDVRYKMLKHRVKKKFYNNLFLINYQKLKVKPYVQGEQECFLLLHHANLFLKQIDYRLAELNARKIISIANEFDFTNFKIAALEILLFCNSESGSYKDFERNRKELDSLMRKKAYERDAVNLFQVIKIKLNKSIKSRREYLPQLEKDVRKLEVLWKKSKTFDAFNAYYKTHISYYELIGDFSKIVELTILSEKLLENGEVCAQRFDSSFNKYVLVYAHLKAADYKKGLFYAEKYLPDFNNTHNLFNYLENYFLLALHSQKYELASLLLDKVFTNNSYSKISATAKERWQLYQAYLSIINGNLYLKKISNPYLISLPEYSKDKQGFNVAILILQFFYFLQRRDLEALLYRIESLKKYVHTHLKDTFSLRSKLFLKLLILSVTEDFDAESIRKKGRKNFEKLSDMPPPGDAYAEIEIVPYEHLWELILDVLQKRY